MTLDAFTLAFVAAMVRLAGSTLPNGMAVEDYARTAAKVYWSEPSCREQGPEACAEDDFLTLGI